MTSAAPLQHLRMRQRATLHPQLTAFHHLAAMGTHAASGIRLASDTRLTPDSTALYAFPILYKKAPVEVVEANYLSGFDRQQKLAQKNPKCGLKLMAGSSTAEYYNRESLELDKGSPQLMNTKQFLMVFQAAQSGRVEEVLMKLPTLMDLR